MSRIIGVKTPKELILRKLEDRILGQINSSLYNTNNLANYRSELFPGAYGYSDPGTYTRDKNNHVVPTSHIGWPNDLKEYIHRCVLHAFDAFIEELYTDEDFERDVKLKEEW